MRESENQNSHSPYRFPHGLKHNLFWYAFRKFRPANPIQLFEYLAKEFGDIAHYKIGPYHIVFLNRAEWIREVLVVQNDNFVKERTVQRTKMLLGEGMITSEGPAHRAQRQVAQPAFHRQRIAQYAAMMVQETQRIQETWRDGEQIDLAQQMMCLTLRIVARTLFSTELEGEAQQLADAINRIMSIYNYLVALPAVEVLIHMRVPGLSRFPGAKRTVDQIVYRMIEHHRRTLGQNNDLLDMMLQAPESNADSHADQATLDRRLRDQVITIFLAGYETVANALTWTCYLLSQNQAAESKLHAELQAVLAGRTPNMEDLPALKYTEAVFAESMRLYPPAWAMGRQARNDFDLGPYRLPAGTTVLISQFVAHRDPTRFVDPLVFNPDRFAAGRSSFPKFDYFPFGAGFRQCIGEAFAWMEGSLVLATLASRWKFRLSSGQRVEPQPLITLRPKYGMRMILESTRDL